MTEQMAIEERLPNETLENAIGVYETVVEATKDVDDEDYSPVFDKVTIRFLKELQQYRAIGTIAELQALKEIDNDCTIRHLTGECSYNETGCSGCIGREKIKVALEKSVAKKAIVYGHNDAVGTDIGLCPMCNSRPLRACDNQYCPDCGQHLSWE